MHIYYNVVCVCNGEGNGTPLQYSCLENPMDGGAWWAAIHGVSKSRTRLSDFTFTFHFYALEKEMATHSSVLAWRIPGTGEPDGLPFMESHRVGHNWSDLAAAAIKNKCYLLFYFWKNLWKIITLILVFGINYLWCCLVIGFPLWNIFWLLTKSLYMLEVYSDFLFLFEAVLVTCVFLENFQFI